MDHCAEAARNAAALTDTYTRHLRGDATTNQVIASAMYLIGATVATAIRKFPPAARLRDDLRSAGYLALCEACQELTVPSDKLIGYLATAARHAIQEAIAGETELMPARRQRENPDREPQRFESLSDSAAAKLAAPEDRSAELLDDILVGCCTDDTDRAIVKLRAQSRTDVEVAALVNLSESSVRQRRDAVYAKFLARNPDLRAKTQEKGK